MCAFLCVCTCVFYLHFFVQIDYEVAVGECLAGAVKDLTSQNNKIKTMERESEEMEKRKKIHILDIYTQNISINM